MLVFKAEYKCCIGISFHFILFLYDVICTLFASFLLYLYWLTEFWFVFCLFVVWAPFTATPYILSIRLCLETQGLWNCIAFTANTNFTYLTHLTQLFFVTRTQTFTYKRNSPPFGHNKWVEFGRACDNSSEVSISDKTKNVFFFFFFIIHKCVFVIFHIGVANIVDSKEFIPNKMANLYLPSDLADVKFLLKKMVMKLNRSQRTKVFWRPIARYFV